MKKKTKKKSTNLKKTVSSVTCLILLYSLAMIFLRKQKLKLLKNKIFYEVKLTVTQNQRWKQFFAR